MQEVAPACSSPSSAVHRADATAGTGKVRRNLWPGVRDDPARDRLFWLRSTHPATDRRIERLVAMAEARRQPVARPRTGR